MENTSAGQRILEKSIKRLTEDMNEPSREIALRLAANLLDYLRQMMMTGPNASGSTSSSGASTPMLTINCPHPACGRPIKVSLS